MGADLALLAVLWTAAVLVVHPAGDFPLNDDWCYGQAVRSIVDEGSYRPLGWTTVTLVSQALWGALFSLLIGFSYDALRLSTLLLGLSGVLATYLVVREAGGGRRAALFGALALAANPIYFALAHTFMTDVPFLGLAAPSLLFLMRSLRSGSNRDLALGTALATAAILCRKLGLFLPIAFACALLVRRGFSPGSALRALLPLAAGLAALLLFESWLRASGALPYKYDLQTREFWEAIAAPGRLLAAAPKRIVASGVYLGLFLSPLLLLPVENGRGDRRGPGLRARAALIAAAVIASALLLRGGARMPLGVNVIEPGGIGPVTLRDVFLLGLPHAPALPRLFWSAVTVAGVAACVFLAARLAAGVRDTARRLRSGSSGDEPIARLFLLVCAAVYATPLFAGPMFDRYLLPLVPLGAAILFAGPAALPGGGGAISRAFASRAARARAAPAVAAVLLLSFYAVAGTHDYLAWNRARWGALDDLVEKDGVAPSRIDGGYEFNGSFTYQETGRPAGGKSWWWVVDDEFVLTMGPLPGYAPHRVVAYRRWMPAGEERVYVLKREPGAGGDRSGRP
jgi:4-amino-4-deoxy-L-arabinose transferase-like glycosyltransferase